MSDIEIHYATVATEPALPAPRVEVICSICLRPAAGHSHGPGQMQALLRVMPR